MGVAEVTSDLQMLLACAPVCVAPRQPAGLHTACLHGWEWSGAWKIVWCQEHSICEGVLFLFKKKKKRIPAVIFLVLKSVHLVLFSAVCLITVFFFPVVFQYWPAILHSEFFFFLNDLTIDFTWGSGCHYKQNPRILLSEANKKKFACDRALNELN